MLWCRFYIPLKECDNDYRPVIWPIRYPYWCTGYTDTEAILVAYVKNMDEFFMQWPEMDKFLDKHPNKIEVEECEEVEFSSRFQRPDWYTDEHIQKMKELNVISDLKDLFIYRPVVKDYKSRQEKFVEKFGHWWYLRDLDFLPAPCEDKSNVFKMDGKWKTYGWALFNSLDAAREASNKARMAVGLNKYNFT